MKVLLHWSPGACSWQTPRRLASWEVMSRFVREPALRGAVHGCETDQRLVSLTVLDPGLPQEEPRGWQPPLFSVSPLLEAAPGACIALGGGGRWEKGRRRRWQGSGATGPALC